MASTPENRPQTPEEIYEAQLTALETEAELEQKHVFQTMRDRGYIARIEQYTGEITFVGENGEIKDRMSKPNDYEYSWYIPDPEPLYSGYDRSLRIVIGRVVPHNGSMTHELVRVDALGTWVEVSGSRVEHRSALTGGGLAGARFGDHLAAALADPLRKPLDPRG